MISREEAKRAVSHRMAETQEQWDIIDEIYDSFEPELKAKDEEIEAAQSLDDFRLQTIACLETELSKRKEPLSCEGCKYEQDKKYDRCYAFENCIRDGNDHYTPKAKG